MESSIEFPDSMEYLTEKTFFEFDCADPRADLASVCTLDNIQNQIGKHWGLHLNRLSA
jgi:hypothetical protein